VRAGAPRLSQDPFAYLLVQRPRRHQGQEFQSIGRLEAFDRKLRQTPEVLARLVRGEQDHHRLGRQPPGHKRQCLRRGPIQPLRIVDYAQKRSLLSPGRQQVQRSQANQETIWRGPRTRAECGRERILLPLGQTPETIEDQAGHVWHTVQGAWSGLPSSRPCQQRHHQLMQARERQVRFGLHSYRA
jgi:hypothetical protein